MTALPHVSASAISSYKQCARRYYADKRLGIREEESPAMALGTAIHSEMEAWFEKGVIPTHPSARLMTEHPDAPKRGGQILIEWPRSYYFEVEPKDAEGKRPLLKAAGVTVKGRIDLVEAVSDEYIRCWDWKSSGNLKYAKTALALEDNEQAVIYLKALYGRFPTVQRITFHHGNISSNAEKPPAAKVTSTRELDRTFIDERFKAVEAVVEQMKDVMALDDVESVPGNPEACWAYRKRCPFAASCSVFKAHHGEARDALDPVEDEDSPTTTGAEPMTLQKLLAAKKAAVSGVPLEMQSALGVPDSEGTATSVTAVGILPPDAASPAPAPLSGEGTSTEDRLLVMERRQAALAERIAALETKVGGAV